VTRHSHQPEQAVTVTARVVITHSQAEGLGRQGFVEDEPALLESQDYSNIIRKSQQMKWAKDSGGVVLFESLHIFGSGFKNELLKIYMCRHQDRSVNLV
jgi:hypothetical protein